MLRRKDYEGTLDYAELNACEHRTRSLPGISPGQVRPEAGGWLMQASPVGVLLLTEIPECALGPLLPGNRPRHGVGGLHGTWHSDLGSSTRWARQAALWSIAKPGQELVSTAGLRSMTAVFLAWPADATRSCPLKQSHWHRFQRTKFKSALATRAPRKMGQMAPVTVAIPSKAIVKSA